MAGCATRYGPGTFGAGAPRDEVTRALGQPTGVYTLANANRRLEFARGPMGKHTYMFDFDANDRLLSSSQVLDEAHFNAIRAGMTRDQVLTTIGRPSEQSRLPVQAHLLWSYRYDNPFCQWFQVSVNAADKVCETGYGPDPVCTERDLGS
jgi:hypothetical protein